MGISSSWVWDEPRVPPDHAENAPQIVAAISGAGGVQVNGGIFNTAGYLTVNNFYCSRDEDRIAKLLDWLTEINFRNLHIETLERRTPGTGMHFLRSGQFQEWMQRPGSILWGIGMPGAGKTFLASIVIDHLESLAKGAGGSMSVAFVYCRHTDKIPVRDILAGLVRQLLERNGSLFPLVEPLYEQHFLERTQPTQHELLDVLASIANVIKTNFFILEGLDEAPVDAQFDLLEALASLNVNTFITSRPLQQLEAQAEEWSNVEFFKVAAHEEDLDLFLSYRINRFPSLARCLHDRSFRSQVLSIIKQKSDGMFLHASLHVEALRLCLTKKDVLDTLERLPTGVEQIYEATLMRVEAMPKSHRDLVMRVLLWLVFSRRSMSVEEVQYAAVAWPPERLVDEDSLVCEDTLVSLCCGLVTTGYRTGVRHPITQYESGYRIVHLIHHTAKEALKPALVDYFSDPHSAIARVCISRLHSCNLHQSVFNSEGDLMDAFDENPLLAYAYYAWSYHAHRCTTSGAKDTISDFISRCTSFPSTPVERRLFDGTVDRLEALQVAAQYGFLEPFLDGNVASLNAGTRQFKRSPLMLASWHGHEHIVDYLLSNPDIDINAVDEMGWSPLMFASESGHVGIVNLLLEMPTIEVNKRNDAGSTALILAAEAGYIEVVDALLGCKGIQVNIADKEGMTAISHACQNDNGAIVRRLLRVPGIRAGVDDDWWRYTEHLSSF